MTSSPILNGMNATVLDGAVIGDNTIIAAASLVPPGKALDSGFLWVGSPVKKVRALTADEIASLPYSAGNYVKLAQTTKNASKTINSGD